VSILDGYFDTTIGKAIEKRAQKASGEVYNTDPMTRTWEQALRYRLDMDFALADFLFSFATTRINPEGYMKGTI
jgi:hypothetical protein